MKYIHDHVEYNASEIAYAAGGTREEIKNKAYEVLLEAIEGEQIEFISHLNTLKSMATDQQLICHIDSLIIMYN